MSRTRSEEWLSSCELCSSSAAGIAQAKRFKGLEFGDSGNAGRSRWDANIWSHLETKRTPCFRRLQIHSEISITYFCPDRRACHLGRRRERRSDPTLKSYKSRLDARIDQLMALKPSHRRRELQSMIRRIGASLRQQRLRARTTPVHRVSKDHQRFSHRGGARLYADIRYTIETASRRAIRARGLKINVLFARLSSASGSARRHIRWPINRAPCRPREDREPRAKRERSLARSARGQ